MSLKEKAMAFKGLVTLFAGALLTTLVFSGCPQSKDENTHPAKKYKVTLNKTAGGDVTTSPKLSADGMMEENTEIIFTAKEDEGYEVDSWTISAGTFAEGGTKGSKTAKIKVSQDVAISVIFKKNGGVEEGVWKILSAKQIQNGKEETVEYPQTLPDKKSMLQPYICLSEGKIYGANEITNSSEADKNGMFQEELWDVAYTYANNAITIGQQLMPFVVTGNTATMTMAEDENNKMIATLQRVSSPTVAEIKAAKKI